ncbi:hypothetical protein GQ53DRAFT_845158 [Thozetella sp. PMI_491]|nr:hypothetical protein GQ53DRAFT_845158 [Thozetella sp. PMI_491]
MDGFCAALSDHGARSHYAYANAKAINVTELRRNKSTGVIRTQNSSIPVVELGDWLARTSGDDDTNAEVAIFRIVWAELNNDRSQVGLPRPVLSKILDAFGLQLAEKYSASHITGVAELSPTSRSRRVFAFAHQPKLQALWSYTARVNNDSATSTTNVVVVLTRAKIDLMKALLDIRWEESMASHTMFPLLLCSLLFGQEIHDTQKDIKIDLRGVEVRTGYHRFTHLRERPATGELGELCARMSGCETKLASVSRKINTLEEMCTFMARYPRSDRKATQSQPSASGGNPSGALHADPGFPHDEILSRSLCLLRDQLRAQAIDNDYIKQRVRIQIEALFNLITQHDSLISLRIAQASQLSAVSSQQDSSSMKTLAVVTMLFLPGSFVSSLFSIDVFNWDTSNAVNPLAIDVSPAFGLYWLVAISLTILVFAIYGLWLLFHHRRQKRLTRDARWEIIQPAALEELIDAIGGCPKDIVVESVMLYILRYRQRTPSL